MALRLSAVVARRHHMFAQVGLCWNVKRWSQSPERFQWTFWQESIQQENLKFRCHIYSPEDEWHHHFTFTVLLYQVANGRKRRAIFIPKIETPHMDGDCTEPGYESSMGGGPLSFITLLKPEIAPIWECEVKWKHRRQPFRKKKSMLPFVKGWHRWSILWNKNNTEEK